MNTKALSLTIILSSISIVTNPGLTGLQIRMPFTDLYFHFWEIPLIVLFLIVGFRYALLATLINSVFLFGYFPGPSNPFYALASVIAVTCTIIGIYTTQKFLLRRQRTDAFEGNAVWLSVVFVLLIRIPIMAIVRYGIQVYAYNAPAWWALNIQVPIQAVYNIILISYTIPTAYLIFKTVSNLRTQKKGIDSKHSKSQLSITESRNDPA